MRLGSAVDYFLEADTDERRATFEGAAGLWADLTGGFDTRLNTLLLRRAGVQFDAGTRATDPDDVRIARAVAGITGWNWTLTALPANWSERVTSSLELALAWGDGHLDAVDLAAVLYLDSERARKHNRSVSGALGETLRAFAAQQEGLMAGRTSRVNYRNYINMRLLNALDMSIFKDDPTDAVRDDLYMRLNAWTAPYADEPNTSQIDVIYYYRNTGHAGAFASAAAAFLDVDIPFASKLTATTMMSMDYGLRRGDRFARTLIDRLDRRVAALPTTWGGPASPLRIGNAHRFVPYYMNFGKRVANKLVQSTLGRPLFARHTTNKEHQAAIRRAVIQYLGVSPGGLTYRGMRSARLYRETELNAFLERAVRHDFSEGALFGRVVTLEAALRAVGATVT
jgi:hypothetical protein